MLATTEQLEWIPVTARLPDAEAVVMVHIPESSEPVWLGVLMDDACGEPHWHSIDGYPFASHVDHWAELPRGPQS